MFSWIEAGPNFCRLVLIPRTRCHAMENIAEKIIGKEGRMGEATHFIAYPKSFTFSMG
jgi:hypothetical protein